MRVTKIARETHKLNPLQRARGRDSAGNSGNSFSILRRRLTIGSFVLKCARGSRAPVFLERDQPLQSNLRSRIRRALRYFQTFIASGLKRLGFIVTLLDRQIFAQCAVGEGYPIVALRQEMGANLNCFPQDFLSFLWLIGLRQDQTFDHQGGGIMIVKGAPTLAIDF